MNIPQLIIDLAIMLSVAAVVTIVFKKLKIPTLLGYILAGFLIGPNFPMFLEVESISSIETLGEIGVVIILFHIGLEFDFKKIANIGGTAVVSALIKMAGVMAVGYFFGIMLGMNTMNSIFLGAMLSISSTVVIQKCLQELELEKEQFAGLVMGSLVIEDVIAIFIMVVLNTISVGQDGGSGIGIRLSLMLAYLIIWLVLGIYLVPTWLNRAMKFMNEEMLTLLSLGFCFLMALLAGRLGFSMELGAFLAGSFFAGTNYVHQIERATQGVKDMFGAIFFLSVGMMVDPHIIATKWTSIIPIAIIAVIAKLLFASIGMVLSGQELETAVKGGACLAPIGEFSFIIASLGISLGVMEEYLYPVIVASSILTIIFTPSLMKKADGIVAAVKRILPNRLLRLIDDFTSSDQCDDAEEISEWKIVLKGITIKTLIYGCIMLVAALVGVHVLQPYLEPLIGSTMSIVVSLAAIYITMAVFIRPYMGHRTSAFTNLWMEKLSNRPPLLVLVMMKVAIIVGIAYYPVRKMLYLGSGLALIAIILVLIVISRSDFIASYYLQLETRFLSNLNQKTMDEVNGKNEQHWLEEDYSIFSWFVPEGAPYAGKSIEELDWGRKKSIYVVKLRRGNRNIVMPPAKMVIRPGDKVYVIADENTLRGFHKTLDIGELKNLRTLKDFLDGAYPDKEHALSCLALKVRGSESYAYKSIKKSGFGAKAHCMVLGLERKGYTTTMPDANMIIEAGDILWLIGTNDNLSRIAIHSVGEVGHHATQPGHSGAGVEERE